MPSPQPLKRSRKFEPRPSRPPVLPRIVRALFVFVAVLIVIDSLFGDRGFVDTLRARREYAALEASVARLKADNARLREQARRLREDPQAIEAVAREDLGLIRPGETLFIIADRTRTTRLK